MKYPFSRLDWHQYMTNTVEFREVAQKSGESRFSEPARDVGGAEKHCNATGRRI